MKKLIAFLSFILSACCSFALDSEYFKDLNLKNIYLYTNSPEGLRIRDKPSLSSNKIGCLYDNMEVKPVEIGKEETIDGIKSNWIKIIIPAESLQKNTPVYGWIFGGYLNSHIKKLSTENWTDQDLIRYLSRFPWIDENRYLSFTSDLKFSMGRMESGAGGNGTYSVSVKNKTIVIKASYGDEEGTGPVETSLYKYEIVDEGNIVLTSEKTKYDLKPAITNHYFYCRMFREVPVIEDYEKDIFTAFCYPSFSTDLILDLYHKLQETSSQDDQDEITNYIKNLQLLGVDTGW